MMTVAIENGSGNVFADLGFPDADDLLIRAQLLTAVQRRVSELGLGSADAAERLAIEESLADEILAGRFIEASAEELLGMISRLGFDVDIVLRLHGFAGFGRVRVAAA